MIKNRQGVDNLRVKESNDCRLTVNVSNEVFVLAGDVCIITSEWIPPPDEDEEPPFTDEEEEFITEGL